MKSVIRRLEIQLWDSRKKNKELKEETEALKKEVERLKDLNLCMRIKTGGD